VTLPLICAFRRSGTHYAAKLIQENLDTGIDDYEKLHGSHSRALAQPYICIRRHIVPTMISYYKMRERFGIHRSVTFTEMITAKAKDLRKAEACDVLRDGERVTKAHVPDYGEWTLPEAHRFIGIRLARHALRTYQYNDIVDDPYAFVRSVMRAFKLHMRPDRAFSDIKSRVGWVPTIDSETVELTSDDYRLLSSYS
jgi:hypothetical protein